MTVEPQVDATTSDDEWIWKGDEIDPPDKWNIVGGETEEADQDEAPDEKEADVYRESKEESELDSPDEEEVAKKQRAISKRINSLEIILKASDSPEEIQKRNERAQSSGRPLGKNPKHFLRVVKTFDQCKLAGLKVDYHIWNTILGKKKVTFPNGEGCRLSSQNRRNRNEVGSTPRKLVPRIIVEKIRDLKKRKQKIDWVPTRRSDLPLTWMACYLNNIFPDPRNSNWEKFECYPTCGNINCITHLVWGPSQNNPARNEAREKVKKREIVRKMQLQLQVEYGEVMPEAVWAITEDIEKGIDEGRYDKGDVTNLINTLLKIDIKDNARIVVDLKTLEFLAEEPF